MKNLCLMLGLLLLLLCATTPTYAQRFGGPRGSEQTLSCDDLNRTYVLYEPAENSTEARVLVMVLHGGGGQSQQIERQTRFNALADKEGFVVCYPQGVEKNWNDGRGDKYIPAQSKDVDDVKFLRRLIMLLVEKHKVDRNRIFITGISNGGFMSHRMAAEASDLICGIAPVVGGMPATVAKNFHPQHPVSIFVIQGTHDPLVPFEGGEVGFRAGRKRGSFISTEDAIQKYLMLNQINEAPSISEVSDTDPDDGTTTEKRKYPAGKDGAQVQVFVIHDGGHGWPGGTQYFPEKLIGKVCKDYSATNEIWSFFKSCSPKAN